MDKESLTKFHDVFDHFCKFTKFRSFEGLDAVMTKVNEHTQYAYCGLHVLLEILINVTFYEKKG